MSDTVTIDVPRGLDALDASDLQLLNQMRADEVAEPEEASEATPEPAPQPRQTAPERPAEAVPELDDIEPDEEPGAAQRQDMVPHKALHAMNEKRKQAEARAREAETKLATEMARAQERLEMLLRAAQAAAPTPAPEASPQEQPLPDPATDPVGYFQAVTERQAKQIGELSNQLTGYQRQQSEGAALQDMRNWATANEQAFIARQPDYTEAMAFLRQNRDAEWQDAGVTDPRERHQLILNEITAIANKARHDGGDFAGRLYAIAQRRGWKVPPPTAPAPLEDAPPARVARSAAARDNATTISGVGVAPPARLSVEKIADMPEEQFTALLGKMAGNKQALMDLLGH